MNEARASAVRVSVIESAQEFAALADVWENLQAKALITSVFASFDWQYHWWQTYGRDRRLQLLVAWDGPTVVGLLPLYIQTVFTFGFPVRLLRFVGTGGDTSPDDLGPVLAPPREVEVAGALGDAVLSLAGWDVLLLTDMIPSCAFTAVMEGSARRGGLTCVTGRSERISYVDLHGTFEAWLASLHRNRRYRIRNARRKLTAAHRTRFFVWSDPATLDDGVAKLAQLHRKRWQSVGEKSHSFASPEYLAFHRAVMISSFKRDRLRLYCLEVEGKIVAIFYFYKFRDCVYLMQSGFDPDFAELRPGHVLLGYVIEHAIGEKQKRLDFLRGDHRYKEELSSGERDTTYLTGLRPRPAAWAYGMRKILLPALKSVAVDLARRLRPAKAS